MGRQDNSQTIEKGLSDLANEKPRRYSHEELMNFTSNLENKVGSGGFGDVYKGKLTNGVEIAVKVLQEKSNKIMREQFWAEVSTVGRAYHQNIIKLYGYCFDETNMIALVYEYMKNGSLDTILFGNSNKIEWAKLYDIAIEIANGLSYLHEHCNPKIIHYDIKVGNVLLDLRFSPKIIDFGMAIQYDKDLSQVKLSGYRGTEGFIAPEVVRGQRVTHKSDVYSFGMMLFEILRREKNSVGSTRWWFPGEVAVKVEQGKLDQIIMVCDIKEQDKEKAEKLSIVALWCTQQKHENRLDMSSVVQILKDKNPIMQHLRKPPNPFPFYDSSAESSLQELPMYSPAIPKVLNEKLSYKESENPIVKQQALVNIPPKPMSEHVAISFAKENVDALINCVKQDIGFSQGIPVAAFTIHRCLVYWRSFEAENTIVFDCLFEMIDSAIENQEKNNRMAYWLSNTSSLLFLLQKTGLDTVRQVEVKYPALLFNKQLTAFVEKIYGIILDNSKKKLKPSLSLRVQVPKMTTPLRGSGRSSGNNSPTGYWRTIIESLHSLLSILKQDFVPPVLIRKIFTQIFSYINVELFNSLLCQECFSSSNVENVKNGLDELEWWCSQAKEEYAGSSWDEVRHIGQAVAFLLIQPKSGISYDKIKKDICPVLSVQQLHRICKLCGDDKFKSRSVSSEVTSRIREVMAEYSNSAASELLWLEDDSSIPFSADDISNSLREKDFSKVKPAAKLLENPAFQFLQE